MSEVTIEPTHTEQGRTVHYCMNCDYEYATDYVPPVGHSLQQEIHSPTCTEQGYTYNYCSCGYHYNTDFTEPLGHTLSVEEVSPTCNTEGYKIADCSVCGYHYTYDVVAPRGHDMDTEQTFVSADTDMAHTTFTCKTCGLSYTRDISYNEVYTGAYVENTNVLAKGIDVSYYNHSTDSKGNYLPLDWELIKSQGYDFAIIRIGYMETQTKIFLDPTFEMNYTGAKAAGLDVGAYFYSCAYSIEDAECEVTAVLKELKDKQFEYPIFFDIEYDLQSKDALEKLDFTNNPDILTDICFTFINGLQKNGYFAALYANNNWLTYKLDKDRLSQWFDIWYARYPISGKTVVNEATWNFNLYGKQMAMWQFSSTGTVDGIYDTAGKLMTFDKNYAYKDYPSIMKKYGLNGYKPAKDTTNLDGKFSKGTAEQT